MEAAPVAKTPDPDHSFEEVGCLTRRPPKTRAGGTVDLFSSVSDAFRTETAGTTYWSPCWATTFTTVPTTSAATALK